MRLSLLYFVLVINILNSHAQTPSASTILQKSIQYHDPQGIWGKNKLALHIAESRPNGPTRNTKVEINLPESYFKMQQTRDSVVIERIIQNDQCTFTLNGKTTISEEDTKKYGLNCERSLSTRNYYTYLWGLPMKLQDPGTILHESVEVADFFGKKAYQLRVTYDAQVGSDVWFFYFNPDNYALIGYKFYHDEAKKDGEYILLEQEATLNGLRLPKVRHWYLNQSDKFLATDTLQE
ncbi:MAG: DUF6503 family protein [Saprospiraceae bacterium]